MSKHSKYNEYLRTPHWARTRQWYYQHHPRQCYVCDGHDRLALHHRTYANLGCEHLDDLVCLCGRCHAILHNQPWHEDSHIELRLRYLKLGPAALKTPKTPRRRSKNRPRVRNAAKKRGADPRIVKAYYGCPHCGALPGEKCRNGARAKSQKQLHDARYQAWADARGKTLPPTT